MTILDIIRKGRQKFKVINPVGAAIGFDEFGAEIHPKGNSPEMPVRLRQVEGRDMAVLRMIRSELSRAANQRGFESIEEADDFDVSDLEDGDPLSPYEVVDMQAEEPMVDDKGQLRLPETPAKKAPVGSGASEDMEVRTPSVESGTDGKK